MPPGDTLSAAKCAAFSDGDARLSSVVCAWPALPDAIRKAIAKIAQCFNRPN
jgi:hypothetical protein